MRKIQRVCFALILTTVFVAPHIEGADRVIEKKFDTSALKLLSLDVGVGDVVVSQKDTRHEITVKISLHPRRGGLFSSLRTGEKQVESAKLKEKRSGDKLQLSVSADKDNQRFEENWELSIPAGLGLDIDLGVGDFNLEGLSGDAKIEIGVGDARISHSSGDLVLSVGVGDIQINSQRSAIKNISAETGVGDVKIVDRGKQLEGDGMVGKSLNWSGEGESTMELEAGVGDINAKVK